MYYSAIGLLAVLILLIENQDVILNQEGAFEKPAWRVYRRFLFAVLTYYILDIFWGVIESMKLPNLLFANTTFYFIAMAVGVLFWVEYTVVYLDEESGFGKSLVLAGRVLAGFITVFAVVNIFTPVLFTVDSRCVYKALPLRSVLLACQILLLLLIAVYAVVSMFRSHAEKRGKYRTLGLFGLLMAVLLFLQIWYPLLPLYTIAYMLGTCLLHTFVVNEEKAEFKRGLEEAAKDKQLKSTIESLLNNLPGMTFTKDAGTGVYLACNRAFAAAAGQKNPEAVIGRTDAELFDEERARHFADDQRVAMSMDEPYIFYEDAVDEDGRRLQVQTALIKYTDDAGRLCMLGISQDVTDMVRIQRESATTKEAYEKARSTGLMYSHIAQSMTRGYRDMYYVNVDSEEFIEYSTDEAGGALTELRRGWHFFEECQIEAEQYVYADDRAAFIKALDRKTLMDTLDRNKTFVMTYRLITEDGPTYVSMRVSRMEDDERYIVIGVTDVDEQAKQRLAEERMKEERTAYTRLSALAGDYLCIYVVDPETGRYREFSSSARFESFAQEKEGGDFYHAVLETARVYCHPEDLTRFFSAFQGKHSVRDRTPRHFHAELPHHDRGSAPLRGAQGRHRGGEGGQAPDRRPQRHRCPGSSGGGICPKPCQGAQGGQYRRADRREEPPCLSGGGGPAEPSDRGEPRAGICRVDPGRERPQKSQRYRRTRCRGSFPAQRLYDRLQYFQSQSRLSHRRRRVCGHLTGRRLCLYRRADRACSRA